MCVAIQYCEHHNTVSAKIDVQLFARPSLDPHIMKTLVIAWNCLFVYYEGCLSGDIGYNLDITSMKFIQGSVIKQLCP
jgi:hypothetical protein